MVAGKVGGHEDALELGQHLERHGLVALAQRLAQHGRKHLERLQCTRDLSVCWRLLLRAYDITSCCKHLQVPEAPRTVCGTNVWRSLRAPGIVLAQVQAQCWEGRRTFMIRKTLRADATFTWMSLTVPGLPAATNIRTYCTEDVLIRC